HDEAAVPVGQGADAPVVTERAEVGDLVTSGGEPPRGGAGSEQQLLERVSIALVIHDALGRQIERRDPAAEVEGDTCIAGLAPDAFERIAFPESLGQWRPG